MLGAKVGAGGAGHARARPPGAGLGDEGYDLTVTPNAVRLVAASSGRPLPRRPDRCASSCPSQGARRVPAVHIRDHPRFAWRGAMLDVARHFRSVRDVERFIDLMALYKLNRLHLHLSDDQGWRIAIAKWPRLATHGGSTEVGGGKGGYYTQAQYEGLVRYAAARYITVVPGDRHAGPRPRRALLVSEARLRREAFTALHGDRGRLQLALHRQARHVRLRLRRGRRAGAAHARPLDPHRRRRGDGDEGSRLRPLHQPGAVDRRVVRQADDRLGGDRAGEAASRNGRPALEHRPGEDRALGACRASRARR